MIIFNDPIYHLDNKQSARNNNKKNVLQREKPFNSHISSSTPGLICLHLSSSFVHIRPPCIPSLSPTVLPLINVANWPKFWRHSAKRPAKKFYKGANSSVKFFEEFSWKETTKGTLRICSFFNIKCQKIIIKHQS
jgi:hypothetical protein